MLFKQIKENPSLNLVKHPRREEESKRKVQSQERRARPLFGPGLGIGSKWWSGPGDPTHPRLGSGCHKGGGGDLCFGGEKGVVAVRVLEEDPDQLQGTPLKKNKMNRRRNKKSKEMEKMKVKMKELHKSQGQKDEEEQDEERMEKMKKGDEEEKRRKKREIKLKRENKRIQKRWKPDNIKQFQQPCAAVAIWNNERLRRMVDVVLKWRSLPPGVASSATTTSGRNEPTRKFEHDSHAMQSQFHTNANESGSSKRRENGKLQHKKKWSKTNE
ncbi:hypothetical protein Sjap_015726 [Stephania japonica]|uniref:Uncharacterized protein n=1 Tax=Stephania japonica TaxID=461633 RepID=A0AAP0IJQ9_9MAGN